MVKQKNRAPAHWTAFKNQTEVAKAHQTTPPPPPKWHHCYILFITIVYTSINRPSNDLKMA